MKKNQKNSPNRTTYSRSITQLMRNASNPDPLILINSLREEHILQTLFTKDEKGRTALDWARLTRNYQGITILLNLMSTQINNARVNSINSFDKLEHLIRQTNEAQGIQLREAIKSRNVNLALQIVVENKLVREEVEGLGECFFADWVGKVGYSPLILAAGMNMKDVVRELINLRVPIDHANRYGHNALTIAAYAGNADIVYYLLHSGADVYHKTNEERTVLHYACKYAKAKVVRIIFDHILERFAVFRNDSHSLTEFDYTRWTTYANMVDSLIIARDYEGKSALDLLPSRLDDMYRIERRLKVSGGTGLNRLDQRKRDNRSLEMNTSYLNMDFESDGEEKEAIDDLYNERFDQMSVGTPMQEDENDIRQEELSELSSIQSSKVSYPEWSHHTDDQQVLEFHPIEDIFSAKTSMPLENEVLYIRQQFERVKDRVINWLINAEKEKALVQLIPCPLNCGTSCKVEEVGNHIRDQCLLRILQCSLCHQIIQFRYVKDHDLNHCPKRTITCEHCYHQISAENLERHLRLLCSRRIVKCRQLCDLAMPYDERDIHEEHHCPNRMIHCDQCKEKMVANTYATHLLLRCSDRFVTCSIGCGQRFKAKDLEHHEENICQKHCRWEGCGRKIGPPAILSFHEQSECPEKPAMCCHSCGISDLTMAYKAEHEQFWCPCLPLYCSNGCNQLIPSHAMDQHTDLFGGDCFERLVICPANLVGWKVLLDDDDDNLEGFVLKYERRFTHPADDRLSVDELYIKTSNGSKWYNVWTTSFTLISKQQSSSEKVNSSNQEHDNNNLSISEHLSCSWIVRSQLRDHLEQRCPYRAVFVKGTHSINKQAVQGNVIGQRTELKTAFQVSTGHSTADDFHEYHQNPDDMACYHCGIILLKTDYQEHLENDCELVDLFCPTGCGKKMKRKEISHHTAELCVKRTVMCDLCQRNDLWAEELVEHQAKECNHRTLICSLHCNIPNIKACEMERHQREDCPHRQIQCPCGLLFESKDLDEHQRLNCVYRVVGCPQGCGQEMSLYLIDNHIEYFCTNRNHIYDRMEECPNGCGTTLMRKELLHHITYDCDKRLIECSNSCGNTFPYDALTGHLVVCPNRLVCCEPNLTMCSKALHEWFYKETPTVDDQPAESSLSLIDNNDVNTTVPSTAATGRSADETMTAMSSPQLRGNQTIISSLENGTFSPNGDGSFSSPVPRDNSIIPRSKATTLYAGQNIQIQASSNPGNASSNFFQNLKIIRVNNPSMNISGSAVGGENHLSASSYFSGKQTQHTLASSSSIYYDENAMKFRDNLRVCFCAKHHSSVIMAAIRYNQIKFLEYILKQLQQSADIDSENIYGDTALTLACRLGRFEFVELLVQNGADINKETSNGRTALIEAVKSDDEHVDLIEYLIKEGCIVGYKTKRHRRSALEWARRYAISDAAALVERHYQATGETLVLTHEKKRLLGRPRTVRILELAAVVQKQSNLLFQQIALGNSELVLQTIENGDMFDPNMEANCYKQMKIFVEQTEKCDTDLNEIQLKLGKNHTKIDTLAARQKELKDELKDIDKVLQRCYKHEKQWDQTINSEFIIYEKSMAKIFSEDFEEISRYQYPSKILLSTIFISGILFDLFPQGSYREETKYPLLCEYARNPLSFPLTNERIFREKNSWWNRLLIKMFLAKSHEIVRKMQSYTRAKLHIERSKQLFVQVKQWIQLLIDCAKEETTGGISTAASTGDLTSFSVSGKPGTASTLMISTRPSTSSEQALEGFIADPSSLDIPYEDFVSPRKKKKNQLLLRDSPNFSGASSPNQSRPSSPLKVHIDSQAPSPVRSAPVSVSRKRLTAEEKYIKELEKEYGLDSDEDQALQGEWVKGEWVPKKPDNKQSKLKTQLLKNISSGNSTGLEFKNTDKESLDETNQRLLFITEQLLQESKTRTLEELKKSSKFISAAGNALEIFDASNIFQGETGNNEDGDEVHRTGDDAFDENADQNSSLSPVRRLTRGKSMRSRSLSRTSSGSSFHSDDSSPASPPLSSPMGSMKRSRSQRKSTLSAGSDDSGSPHRHRKGKDRHHHRRKASAFQTEEERLLLASPLSSYSAEELVGYSFIQSVIYLLKAILKYQTYYSQILQQKPLIFTSVGKIEIAKQELTETIEEYDKLVAIRTRHEKEYIKLLKRSKFLQERLTAFRDRVRVARLMNHVSVNGHTLISWTAAYGNYEVMEAMLSRGGTVGFNADLLHLTATYLQLSYQVYKISCKKYANKYGNNNNGSNSTSAHLTIDGSVGLLKKAENIQIIKELTVIKEKRAKLLAKIHYQKFKLRFPIPEAIYAGKWEIIQRIYERRLWHYNFMNTWTYPSPPPPFQRDRVHQYEHDQLTPIDLLSHAMNSMAAGAYVAQKGWVPPNHPEEPYGELSIVLERILAELKEKRKAFLANRFRIRALSNEKKNQLTGEQEMVKAIHRRDYRHCIFLAENRGITIDLETPDGSTALISASEEDADALNHEYTINDDGSKCLSVEYLLDRQYYRPAINLETTKGYTALIRACVMGRSHVVVALLDRGANINQINRFGKAAIHYTASLGHSDVTRILVERFADLTLTDSNGRTAYEIAEKENYINLMTLLSQFRSGNLGPLQLTRGRVNNQITCPNGCGKILYLLEKKAHLEVCLYRIVPCPNNCSRHDLQAKELVEHVKTTCENRIVFCGKCNVDFPLGYQDMHDTEDCIYRIVPCPYQCDKLDLLYCDVSQHIATRCVHRKIPCPFYCNLSIREIDMEHHLQEECEMRRITCPAKCHHQILAMQLSIHLQQHCPCRIVQCSLCADETILSKDLDYHQKELCSMRPVPCPEKCHEMIPFTNLMEHLRDACLFRCIPCPNECSLLIQRKFLSKHLEKECQNRLVPCPNGCLDGEKSSYLNDVIQCYPMKILEIHVKTECSDRLIRCSYCTLSIKAKYLALHQEKDCLQRIVPCTNEGCRKEIAFQELQNHKDFHCRFRMIDCPQGCHTKVMYIHSKHHMQKDCRMRFVTCTLQCGERMRFFDLPEHLAEACPRRFKLEAQKNDPYAMANIRKKLQKKDLAGKGKATPAAVGKVSQPLREQMENDDEGSTGSVDKDEVLELQSKLSSNTQMKSFKETIGLLAKES